MPVEVARIDRSSKRDVREKLLDVAEKVFAENGVDGSTIRSITAAAEVNGAAINYYFRSKEELYEEVVKRRQSPLIEERLRRLEDCLARTVGERPMVEDILRAMVEPSLQLCFEHPHFARLSSRLRFDRDKSLWSEYLSHQTVMMERYQEALSAALPHLTDEEIYRRFVYVLAEIQHIWSLCPLPEGESVEKLYKSLITFYGAGMRSK